MAGLSLVTCCGGPAAASAGTAADPPPPTTCDHQVRTGPQKAIQAVPAEHSAGWWQAEMPLPPLLSDSTAKGRWGSGLQNGHGSDGFAMVMLSRYCTMRPAQFCSTGVWLPAPARRIPPGSAPSQPASPRCAAGPPVSAAPDPLVSPASNCRFVVAQTNAHVNAHVWCLSLRRMLLLRWNVINVQAGAAFSTSHGHSHAAKHG